MLLPWHNNKTTLVVSPERLWLHLDDKLMEFELSASFSNVNQLMAEITEQLMSYQRELKTKALHIVLSNHFVRYATLPWRVGLNKRSDWLALAENQMRQIYGQKASAWQVNISLQGYGQPAVIAAIDTPILDQFELMAKQFHWPLKTIEPAFSTVSNHYASKFSKQAWLLLAEPQRLLLAQAEKGVWYRFNVAMPPAGDEAKQVLTMLNQAKQSHDSGDRVHLYLHGNSQLFPTSFGDEYIVEQLSVQRTDKLALTNLSYGYLT